MLVRIKTEEEFKRDGIWDYEDNCPEDWPKDAEMDSLLGKTVEVERTVWDWDNTFVIKDGWLIDMEDISEVIEDDS